ncbi:MAG: AMIN domain-containing protein [Terriglobales bacterium]
MGVVLRPLSAQNGAAPQHAMVQPAVMQPGMVQPSTTQTGMVQRVTVRESGEGIEVDIQTSGAVSPDTQAITGPDRIVVDFPGTLPAAQLRALKVNRRGLKGVRSGLFFSNPPITRVVLDLAGPQAYQISSVGSITVVKLTGGATEERSSNSGDGNVRRARLRDAALAGRPNAVAHLAPASVSVNVANRSSAVPVADAAPENVPATAVVDAPQPAMAPGPAVSVSYENGLLRVHADKATLSQVLYEVHLRTGAEIAIPAGAEQEKVSADLGPAPARDVLGELLNGSAYNFIFVGDELALQRVILTRREGNF